VRPYYSDEYVTIYNGDWRDVAPGLAPDLVLADPPYGVGFKTAGRGATSRTRDVASRDWPRIIGDNNPFDPTPFLAYRHVVLWGANHYADKLPPSSSWLLWDKIAGLHTDKREHGFNDMPDAEVAWSNIGGPVRTFRHTWMGLLRASENGQRVLHPTQKPVALMAWCLSFFPDVRLVFDPFMGSGPVPRACKDRGIRCVAAELVEEYCERAAQRCQQEVLDLGGAA
jgi:site-specific DNA-methyltransferase (adenine-specific)